MRPATLSVLLVAAALGAASAGALVPGLVVAVLDTGVDPDHPEFAAGQVVAWWDFTAERSGSVLLPSPTDTWDARGGGPYDWHGHGTATAALVGGANTPTGVATCGKTSYAPGVALAIAKVATFDDVVDLEPAIRWAVDVAGAEVISLSVASIVPATPHLGTTGDALAYARSKGVLVVVAAGNGVARLGLVPFPSETALYAYSPDVLVVGASGRLGPSLVANDGNLDPEVVAWSRSACYATPGGHYETKSGTSYSTPLVAGAAASALADARAGGKDDSPARIEAVLKHAARDSALPYAVEGWGFLGDDEVAAARAAASAGTLPAHPCALDPCMDPLYEAAVADTARAAVALTDVVP